MKRIVGAALLILCSSVAGVAGSPSLSQLQSGERFHVAYHSRGCFHDRNYDIDFERGASVTARSAGHTVTLSAGEIAGLDHLLASYGSRPRGGCTTRDDITIIRFHNGPKISGEHYVDSSCATYQMEHITTFYEVPKTGLEHDT
jgi:hypothetical protein